MFTSRLKQLNSRAVVALALALILGSVTYGFAASNTVPASGAGNGAGTISGYAVTSVVYTLGADPRNIDSVNFTITAAAGVPAPVTVKIKLVLAGSDWYACTVAGAGPYTATCNTTVGVQATVAPADELRVIAISN